MKPGKVLYCKNCFSANPKTERIQMTCVDGKVRWYCWCPECEISRLEPVDGVDYSSQAVTP